jgi:DNA-binding MarR family transcriptional regulator
MDNILEQTKEHQVDDGIVVIKFADSKIPEFKEVKNKDWILYGEDNLYPEYLLYLYNKSARHGAIINSKTKYICGSGLEKSQNIAGGFNNWEEDVNGVKIKHAACIVNRDGETMLDILEKSQKDVEIFGGFRWAIIKNRLGQVLEIYHVDFYKFRKDKDSDGFWYKDDWSKRGEATFHNSFDPNDNVDPNTQIFAYNEYRPGCDYYPMPGYIGCNNYIEVDVEISKFHLSSIKNGLTPSKMIQFYTGEPEENKKKAVERRFREKFAGSENAGKFILVFNSSKEKSVDVNDLSGSQNDKMFDILEKTVEQNIITGHEVVSPMLFGIKTEGQLGGNNEIRTAYEIFINTYGKPKQTKLLRVVNYFGELMGKGCDYGIKQLDPVRIVISDEMIKDVLQPDEIRELAGLPVVKNEDSAGQKILTQLSSVSPLVANKILESLTPDEIRSFVNLGPKLPGTVNADGTIVPVPATTQPTQQERSANLNISMQTLNRIMSVAAKFNAGKLTYEQAMVFIRGFGLTDEEAAVFLVTPEEAAQAQAEPVMPAPQLPVQAAQNFDADGLTEDQVVLMFDQCGELKDDFHIITSKRKQKFTAQSAAEDEANFFHGLYAGVAVTNAEASILALIKKDSKITPEVIAQSIGSTPEYVTSKIASLTKRGVLTSSEVSIGDDIEIERSVTEKVKAPKGEEKTQISVKYSYEVKPGVGDEIIPTTRPFCRKLIKLNRLYSRKEIETISERLGYSVWERRGGWWGDSPTCRHIWVSHVVVKKGKL